MTRAVQQKHQLLWLSLASESGSKIRQAGVGHDVYRVWEHPFNVLPWLTDELPKSPCIAAKGRVLSGEGNNQHILGMCEYQNGAEFCNLYGSTHSFSSLSYERSEASSKSSSPHSANQSFLLQMRVSSPFLKVIQQLPTSSSLSSCHLPCIFPSITRCRRQFLPKMWPIQFAFRLRIPCRIFNK